VSTNFPTSLDTFAVLVDNTDSIVAAHPNDRGDSVEALEAKVGINSSAVGTSHDYLLEHLPTQAANWDAGPYEVRAETFESDVATGTAPMTVASTTVVTNLNANTVNGKSAPSGTIVGTTDSQTLTNKTLTSPAINTGTLTSPVINTGVSGTAILDQDDMSDDSNTKLATQQSIKAYVDAVMSSVYPVGSVYTNAAVATNPETLLGFTSTWVAIEGECVVGLVAGGTFDTLGTVSEGEETHVLTVAELAAHTHTYNIGTDSAGGVGGYGVDEENTSVTTGSTGSDTAHNNIQPSYVCYVWRRTA